MKVVDAGAIVELILGRTEPFALVSEELATPHLADSEVLNVLRNLVRRGAIDEEQGSRAVTSLAALSLTRYPIDRLNRRIWELRHNLTPYDAAYVALAEALDASSLVTKDARLARAPGIRCRTEVLD